MAVIIDIDHETGDTSQWSSTTGDPVVAGAAALAETTYGLSCSVVDSGSSYGSKDVTSVSGINRARFYLDPNSISINYGDYFYIAYLYTSGYFDLVRVILGYTDGIGYYIRAEIRWDDNWSRVATGDYVITDEPHYIEFCVTRATDGGSADGALQLWIDGDSKEAINNIDFYDNFTDLGVFLLGIQGAGASTGTIYLDELIVNDDGSEIGPVGPSGTFIALDTASLSASGQSTTIVPGAVSTGLDTATLTASGITLTVAPGAVAIGLDTALLSASGQTISITPGGVSIGLDTATLTIAGVPVTVYGHILLALDTATLTASGQKVTIRGGAVSVGLDTAGLTAAGQALDVVPGGVNIGLDTALLTLAGQVIGIVPGAVNVGLDTVLLTASGVVISTDPGGVTISLDTGALVLAGQVIEVSPGTPLLICNLMVTVGLETFATLIEQIQTTAAVAVSVDTFAAAGAEIQTTASTTQALETFCNVTVELPC